jgi:prevent-host-death family protein
MSISMNIAEAKAKLSELISRAERGEDVVIARDGQPIVRLSPVQRPGASRLGFLAHLGSVTIAQHAFDPDADEALAAESGDL